MKGTGSWIIGGALGLLAFFGLFAASRAADTAFYYGGFLIAIGAIAAIFIMVASHYNRMDADIARHQGGEV